MFEPQRYLKIFNILIKHAYNATLAKKIYNNSPQGSQIIYFAESDGKGKK
jgi:hypothetical protein